MGNFLQTVSSFCRVTLCREKGEKHIFSDNILDAAAATSALLRGLYSEGARRFPAQCAMARARFLCVSGTG